MKGCFFINLHELNKKQPLKSSSENRTTSFVEQQC